MHPSHTAAAGPTLPSSSSSSFASHLDPSSTAASRPHAPLGPSAPTPADLLLAADDARLASRAAHKAARNTAFARADELVPRALGKEGKMADKRARGQEERAYANRGADAATLGLEVDEGTLMGGDGAGGGSFAAA